MIKSLRLTQMSDLPFWPFLSMFQDPLHCKFHYCWPQWWPQADYICKNKYLRVEKQINIILFAERHLQTHLHMVSTSMPENPKALSPSTQTIRRPLSPLFLSRVAAAIANPRPTPIVPNVPASNLTGYDETQNNDCIMCVPSYKHCESIGLIWLPRHPRELSLCSSSPAT